MTPVFESLLAKYGWILLGVTCGLAARYALPLKKGVRIRPWMVMSDILLLPMVALIAFTLVKQSGLQAEAAAMIGALCAVGADRLVKFYADRFVQKVDNEVRALAEETIGAVRQEVQTVKSGEAVIADTIEGRAPAEYVALKPHPQKASYCARR